MKEDEIENEVITSFSDGLGKEQRYMTPLDPSYVSVDERTLTDLILFSQKMSLLVRFFSTQDIDIGDWTRFFRQSQVVTLAVIANVKLDTLNRVFTKLTEDASKLSPNDTQLEALKEMFHLTVRLAKTFDNWVRDLRVEKGQNGLVEQIQNGIKTGLAPSIGHLKQYSDMAKTEEGIDQDLEVNFGGLSNLWDQDQTSLSNIFVGKNNSEKIKTATASVAAIFQKLLQEALRIQAESQKELSSTLGNLNSVKPHIGLLVAFFKIYHYTQGAINSITARHLDFYYQQVLRLSARTFVPDEAFVYFELAKDNPPYTIEEGSLLNAGNDSTNKPLRYGITETLTVLPAILEQVNTFYIAANSKIYTATKSKGYLTNIYYQENADESTVTTEDAMPKWAVFGEDQYALGTNNRTMGDARVGFALASPTLYLLEGERKIKLSLRFREDDFKEGMQLWLQEMAVEQQISIEAAFAKVMLKAFDISLTTKEGWFTFMHYNAVLVKEEFGLNLLLELDATESAILPYSEKVHQENLNTTWPVCRIIVRPGAPIFPYSLLQNMLLTKFCTEVDVVGVKNLTLYNQSTRLSSDNPFMPLGPTPNVGARFLIGSSEVFEKQLTDLKIFLEWSNLPTDSNGFADYFAVYDTPIINGDYKVNLSRLENREWIPADSSQQEFDLFTTLNSDPNQEDTPLAGNTNFDTIDLNKISGSASYSFTDKLEYTNQTQSGFIALEMTAPEFGFGQHDFTNKLSEVNLLNANQIVQNEGTEGIELLPLPNPPFSPEASSVTLNYSSKSDLFPLEGQVRNTDGNADQFFHLHPMGQHEIEINTNKSPVLLVPSLDATGNLQLGLSGLVGGEELSMYIQISEGSVSDNLKLTQEVTWWVLDDNDWVQFPSQDVLLDTTNNFIQAGIVRLQLPNRLDTDHQVMPDGLVWLQASIQSDLLLSRTAFGVALNGALVEWVDNDNDLSHLQAPLPAGTISGLQGQPAAIKSTSQPFESFNGRLPEDERYFRVRVSERLRNKNRAISYTDYEQLVMDTFQGVYKVKCFSALTQENVTTPGNVLIAIIPDINDPRVNNKYRPKVSRSRLETVRNYLIDHASPFVRIDVVNPFYERIRVICTVEFVNQQNNGALVQQLNEDIQMFLTPWLSTGQDREEFGGSLYKSDIQSFIEARDYVSFVTGFSVVKTIDFDGNFSFSDTAGSDQIVGQEEIRPKLPWSILVTATSHEISVQNNKDYVAPEARGIGNMMIHTDFIVTESSESPNPAQSDSN